MHNPWRRRHLSEDQTIQKDEEGELHLVDADSVQYIFEYTPEQNKYGVGEEEACCKLGGGVTPAHEYDWLRVYYREVSVCVVCVFFPTVSTCTSPNVLSLTYVGDREPTDEHLALLVSAILGSRDCCRQTHPMSQSGECGLQESPKKRMPTGWSQQIRSGFSI